MSSSIIMKLIMAMYLSILPSELFKKKIEKFRWNCQLYLCWCFSFNIYISNIWLYLQTILQPSADFKTEKLSSLGGWQEEEVLGLVGILNSEYICSNCKMIKRELWCWFDLNRCEKMHYLLFYFLFIELWLGV